MKKDKKWCHNQPFARLFGPLYAIIKRHKQHQNFNLGCARKIHHKPQCNLRRRNKELQENASISIEKIPLHVKEMNKKAQEQGIDWVLILSTSTKPKKKNIYIVSDILCYSAENRTAHIYPACSHSCN